MHSSLVNVCQAGLLLALALSSQAVLAQEPQEAQATAAGAQQPPAVPELADLIPLATDLSTRRASLDKAIEDTGDLSSVEHRLGEVNDRVRECADEFLTLKDSNDPRAGRLPELKAEIDFAGDTLARISNTVTKRVRILGNLRRDWLAEQTQWNAWQAELGKQGPLEEITATVAKAQSTIASALDLLRQQLKPSLALQEQIGALQTRITALTLEMDKLLSGGFAVGATPAMLSTQYVSQLATAFKTGVRTGLIRVSWPGSSFIAEQGWILVLQAVLSLGLAIVLLRHRQQLERIEQWRFIARRPIAAGIMVGILSALVFYEQIPDVVRLVLSAVVATAFMRLLGSMLEGWRRQLVYTVAPLVIISNLAYAFGLPVALFRLYVLVAALLLVVFFLRWAAESRRLREAWLYAWVLRLAAILFAAVAVAELRGNAKLAEYVFVSSIRSLAIVLVFGLLRYLVHGALEWVVLRSAPRGVDGVRSAVGLVVRRLDVVGDALIGIVLLSVLLMSWNVYDSPSAAISGLLAKHVALGDQRVTIGLVLLALGSLGASYLASGMLQALVTENVLARRNVDTGVSLAVTRLLHYVLITGGFVIALGLLGVDLTKLTLLISALGVGIGFGLQTVVNNIVCGLILLFERPLRVGDTIELGGRWAKIARIGLRSTTVRTLDQADVIVPNADLITHEVTNWTLTDRHARGSIAVKVVPGSDVALVMQTLRECALAHSGVMKNPEPRILFRSFGGGSLDFELDISILDVDQRLQVESDLHRDIELRFRQVGIEMPS
jgi:small-conductance mechanosensitive channel